MPSTKDGCCIDEFQKCNPRTRHAFLPTPAQGLPNDHGFVAGFFSAS